jgi:adenosine deaminase/adenosine deaminase CECR1
LLELVRQGEQDLQTIRREASTTMACGTPQAQPGCGVTVRYLQQTTRSRPPEEVFAQFVYAFELAKASNQVVGINLVAPEDNPIALRDYTLQMRMLQYLKSVHPEVKVALHAGELTLGLVPPERLRYHIRQALEIGQANRIGHGVAVMYEEQPFQLLELMRRRGVLVEICLTSNEVILNVANQDHPFLDYQRAGVPLALASDDEGISRIDLSNEYLLALRRYNQSYRDLKRLARNSLEYSFLPGQSLWESPQYSRLRPGCRGDSPAAASLSPGCSTYLAANERARAQWKLEQQFVSFEALPTFQAQAQPAGQGRP